MIFLNRVGIVVNVLTLALIGLECILIGTGLSSLEILNQYLQEPNIRISLSYLGLLLWFIGLLILYANYKVNKQEKGVITKTPYGEVKIAKKAIEEFIARVCGEETFVKKVKPKITIKRRWVKVKMMVSLWSDVSAPDASTILQSHTKEVLSTSIGISEVKDIKIVVEEISHQGGKLRGVEYSKAEGVQGRLW